MLEPDQIAPLRTRPLKATEYLRLAETGAFGEEKLELLRGVMIARSPQGKPHANTIMLLNELLVLALGKRAYLRPQLPLVASEDSVPEPDIAVISRSFSLKSGNPEQALLAIEVARSSVNLDRRVKAPLYAEAKISEYWLVDLTRNRVEVYRTPVDGHYTSMELVERDQTLTVLAFPDIQLKVSEFLDPAGA